MNVNDATATATPEVSATEAAIAEQLAIVAAAQDRIRTLRQEAEAEALREQLSGIAESLGSTVEQVQAFLTSVSESSGYGVGYLVSVVTGKHRVSTGGWRA